MKYTKKDGEILKRVYPTPIMTLFEFKGIYFDIEEELDNYLADLRKQGEAMSINKPETFKDLTNDFIYGRHNRLWAQRIDYIGNFNGQTNVIAKSKAFGPTSATYYALYHDIDNKISALGCVHVIEWNWNKKKWGTYLSGREGIYIGPSKREIMDLYEVFKEKGLEISDSKEGDEGQKKYVRDAL